MRGLTSRMISGLMMRVTPVTSHCVRGCHSTVTMTGSPMDANTVFHLDKYSRYIPAAISIKHLLDHGKSANQLGSYMFLKKEIPTRLANMIMELQLLPENFPT